MSNAGGRAILAKNRGIGMRKLIVFGLAVLSAAAWADVADDVRCAEIGFSISIEEKDIDRFRSFIDADARFIGRDLLRGPAAIAEAWAVFTTDDGPSIKWRPRFVEVLEDGRLALTRGPYRMITVDDAGKQTEHWGTFNSVWRRQPDGGWKVVFDAGGESATPPSEDVRALLEQDHGCPFGGD